MNDEEKAQKAAEVAKQVFGAQKAAEVKKLFQDKSAVLNLLNNLTPQQRATAEIVMQNPELLKQLLSSPKALEGLKKILGGGR